MAQNPASSSRILANDMMKPPAIETYAAVSAKARLASDLFGGSNRLAEISARQSISVEAEAQPLTLSFTAMPVVNNQLIAEYANKLPGWQLLGVTLVLDRPAPLFRTPDLMPAFMRGLTPESPPQPAPTAAAVQPANSFTALPRSTPTLLSSTPRSGQPDIFGSVALPIGRTSLDPKWASASQPLPRAGMWSTLVHSARQAGRQQQAEMVNRWVNQRLRFTDDRIGADRWAAASQSLQQGKGDCEDYAIAKMKLLEAAGFDQRSMFLVIVKDLVRRADHAVLAVRIDGELLVLDNMTDRVLPSSQISDYRPIMSFNTYGRWTHGYRVTTPRTAQFAAR